MRAHVEGIKAMLSAANLRVHYGNVPDSPTFPYVLLWSSAGLMVSDEVCGTPDDLDDVLGVTSVGATGEAALVVASLSRAALLGKAPSVTGRKVHPLYLLTSEPVEVDFDVTVPGAGTHPAYLVDRYRLRSEPA